MEQHLEVVYQGAAECMCACPFCGGSSSLGFNDTKGLWICFKCGERGTAKTLVEKLQGVYTEPEIELDEIGDELRSLEHDVQSIQRTLPESYVRRFHQPGRVHELWRLRGFDSAACDRWELGYDFLTGRLTLPFRNPFTGQLAGVIFRNVEGEGPRYKYPKGFSRSSSLYGSWHLADSSFERAVLVEGPTDAVRVDQAGAVVVSQYGSSISPGQIKLLHRLGVKRVVLFFDYDRAGLRATRKAQILSVDFDTEEVSWSKDKYCWHRHVCGCKKSPHFDEHLYQVSFYETMSFCPRRVRCQCGRIHEPDPGSLQVKEISKMLGRTRRI